MPERSKKLRAINIRFLSTIWGRLATVSLVTAIYSVSGSPLWWIASTTTVGKVQSVTEECVFGSGWSRVTSPCSDLATAAKLGQKGITVTDSFPMATITYSVGSGKTLTGRVPGVLGDKSDIDLLVSPFDNSKVSAFSEFRTTEYQLVLNILNVLRLMLFIEVALYYRRRNAHNKAGQASSIS